MSDPVWYENFQILVDKNRVFEFWPGNDMSYTEKINASTRFLIYAGIGNSLIKNDIFPLLVSLILVALMATLVKKNLVRKKKRNHIRKHLNPEQTVKIESNCRKPTENNPFANVLMTDYANPNLPEACAYEDVKGQTWGTYFANFKQNEYDIYNKEHSQRQFYTMPVSTIPNDQNGFASWLFANNDTCKSNPAKCNPIHQSSGGGGGSFS